MLRLLNSKCWRRCRGRGCGSLCVASLLCEELFHGRDNVGEVCRGVLPSKDRRRLVKVVGQSHNGLGIVGTSPFCRLGLRTGEHTPGEGQSGSGEDRRGCGYKLLMEQGNLRNVECHVLDLSIIRRCGKGDLQEGIHGRVSNNPVQGLQYVPLHLGEHFVVVKRATHGLQLPDSWYPVFLIAILGSNEESSTSDKLVVALVNDAAGAVAVEKVDGEEESLGE